MVPATPTTERGLALSMMHGMMLLHGVCAAGRVRVQGFALCLLDHLLTYYLYKKYKSYEGEETYSSSNIE